MITALERDAARRPRDSARTSFESRTEFPGPDEDAEEIATPTRQLSLLEITSGLPDDARDADERMAERRLRDLRGRVKAARAALSVTTGAEEVLRQDWAKAARFYARFEITEENLRIGVPTEQAEPPQDLAELLWIPNVRGLIAKEREVATLAHQEAVRARSPS
ncbi:MAG: hypothetical protein WB778_06600 [Thermoplasmata archaeon]